MDDVEGNLLVDGFDLPSDLIANILLRLDTKEIIESAENVCKTWRSVCINDPHLWRIIHIEKPLDKDEGCRPYERMCRHAVGRSQGQLTEISLKNFGTNRLLEFIAERSRQLRSLKLSNTFISTTCLNAALECFPYLQKLHLYNIRYFDMKDIEGFASSCPGIISLTVYNAFFYGYEYADNYAKAIAKNMTGLRELRLSDSITNVGLLAILDGCPYLEILDIGQCYNVNLDGDSVLSEKCSRVKEFIGNCD